MAATFGGAVIAGVFVVLGALAPDLYRDAFKRGDRFTFADAVGLRDSTATRFDLRVTNGTDTDVLINRATVRWDCGRPGHVANARSDVPMDTIARTASYDTLSVLPPPPPPPLPPGADAERRPDLDPQARATVMTPPWPGASAPEAPREGDSRGDVPGGRESESLEYMVAQRVPPGGSDRFVIVAPLPPSTCFQNHAEVELQTSAGEFSSWARLY